MKIILEGQKKFVRACKECGCRFTYEQADTSEHYLMAPTVNCPSCGSFMFHPGDSEVIGPADDGERKP